MTFEYLMDFWSSLLLLAEDLMNFLLSLPSLTLVFIGSIAVVWLYFNFVRFSHRNASHIATFLTTLGIFGTFVGIAMGLSDFNTENIRDSVPTLIEGLKTAFWSSVAGIFFALLIKFRHLWGQNKFPSKDSKTEFSIDGIVNKLEEINKALVGDEESTLLSQIKLARQDSNDKLDALKSTVEEFVKNMAENNSKALIEALEEVIREFNVKINEQFGENFKQLNEAVGKILEWQENYRTQMEEMIIQQQQTAENMKKATEDYQIAVERTTEFSKAANDLATLIERLNEQKQNMIDLLQDLVKLIESAKTGLPEIETKVIEMVTQISDGTKISNENMIKTVNETSEKLENAITENNQRFNKHIDEIAEKTRQHTNTLQQAMTEELTKSLESFGRQLAGLSEKFVNDYEPLTERLKELVNMVKKVEK